MAGGTGRGEGEGMDLWGEIGGEGDIPDEKSKLGWEMGEVMEGLGVG